MKKLLMGIVAALGIATPALADNAAFDQQLLDNLMPHYSGLTQPGPIQWAYEGEANGIPYSIQGGIGGVAAVSCAGQVTTTHIDALSLADHAGHLNSVGARDWWFDHGDAWDSWTYWKNRTNARMNAASTGLGGFVDMLVNGEDIDYLSRACYAWWMGETATRFERHITIPGSTFNQRVHAIGRSWRTVLMKKLIAALSAIAMSLGIASQAQAAYTHGVGITSEGECNWVDTTL